VRRHFVAGDGPGYGHLDLAEIFNDGIGNSALTFESPPEAESGHWPILEIHHSTFNPSTC
jgi:hypothetical protein